MKFTHPTLSLTKDGSHTLINPVNEQLYHSHGGAILESKHVFIKHNLSNWFQQPIEGPIRVIELGFGGGLNAYLTRIEAEKMGIAVDYQSIELYPVHPDVAKQLNYHQLLEEADASRFNELHQCPWNEAVQLSDHFKLHKVYGDFLQQDFPENHFHCFYYHAFAPKAQPELWTEEVVKRMHRALVPGGILTTFSATGRLGRALKAQGFTHEKPAGVGAKREITRAIK